MTNSDSEKQLERRLRRLELQARRIAVVGAIAAGTIAAALAEEILRTGLSLDRATSRELIIGLFIGVTIYAWYLLSPRR